jgi:hypothetical protein
MNKKNVNSRCNNNLMRLNYSNRNRFISHLFSILRKIAGGDRFSNLIPYIEKAILFVKKKLNRKLYLLDYGCGKMDFSIFFIKKGLIKKAIGVDNYELQNNIVNKKCQYVNILKNKNKFKENQFDVALIIDVLHHIGINKCHNELKKICSTSKYIIIKDHFEYGYFSRQVLRLGDWFGNYGTEINIPKKYFTEMKWQNLIKKLKLNQIKMIKNVNQHKSLFSLILPSKHQFISIIKN